MISSFSKRSVAIIDSDAAHRNEASVALMSYYDISTWSDGKSAIKAMTADPPAVMVVGDAVEPQGGTAFIRAARKEAALAETPVLYIAASPHPRRAAEAREAGANETLAKPYLRSQLVRAISSLMNASIEHEWEALPETPRAALTQSVSAFHAIADVLNTGETVAFATVKNSVQPLVTAIENNDFKAILEGVRNHDDYTYAHSMRVATLLSMLGHAAGFRNNEQLLLASGGLLHDVGKMMIPHQILNKPGRLDPAEFEIMKSHVPETVKYLKAAADIPHAVFVIAEQHHEKIDGTGYPHGLKGGELNELARMAAIVDVFSALTDRRVYKPSMEPADAMRIMTEEMKGHLDPHFVKMFKTILHDEGLLS